jgi:DNA repair exonuclease SbcCD ATPase subunit/DNA repair exonuclease SbcCD nuclease subunit
MIKTIAHLSDFHVRLRHRHKEYRHVFRNLIKDLRNRKPDIIVVAGDIFHSKNHLSPEAIKMAGDIFDRLSKIAPVYVIIGNHDTIVAQKGRMDAVSAVLGLTDNDNVTLFDKSGMYDVDNIVFGVFDFNDEKNFPQHPTRKDDKTYIALFHGPVNKSEINPNFFLESRFTVDMFDGYDIGMLGDIHSRQDLQQYEDSRQGRRTKPIVSYSGSLCQQNFGESHDKGYLLWDIQKRTYEFIKVENDYGYRTISIDTADIDKLTEINYELPPKPYIRVLLNHDCYDLTKIKFIESHLTDKYEPLYLSIEVDTQKSERVSGVTTADVEDVTDVEVQQKLLQEYYAMYPAIVAEDVKSAMTVHKELYKSVVSNETELTKGRHWTIESVRFSNMFSYGEDNEINFSSMNGITGVFSPNAYGKSSMLATILTAFFNTSSRASRGTIVDVINQHKDKATIEVYFSIDTKKYVIRREIKRTKKDPNRAKNTIQVFEIVNGEEINKMGKNNTNATEKYIRNMLGSYEEHTMTTFSQQFDATSFIDYNQSNRKELLSKFLGLDIIDTLYRMLREENLTIKKSLAVYNTHDYNAINREYEDREVELQTELDELGVERDSRYDKVKEKHTKITHLTSQLKSIDGKELSKKDLEQELETLNKDNESKKIGIQSVVEGQKGFVEETEVLTAKLTEFEDEETLATRIEVWGEKREEEARLRGQQNLLNKNMDDRKRDLNILDTHEWFKTSDQCNKCTFLSDAHVAKNTIPSIKEDLIQIESYIVEVKGYMDKYVDDKPNLKKLRKIKEILQRNARVIPANEYNIKNAEHCIKINNDKIDIIKANIESYKKDKFSIEFNEKVREEIDLLKVEVEKDEQYIKDEIDSNISNKNVEYGQVNQKLLEISEIIETIKKIEDKFRVNTLLARALSNNGIPLMIMDKVIPIVNTEISKTLANVDNFDVQLEVDAEEQLLHIFIDDGNGRRKIELGSGMEKTLAALAVRAALSNISLLPMCNLFVIDEGFGTLDVDHLGTVTQLLQYLKTRFDNVIIISHIDHLKDVVDNVITIDKDEYGYSSIKIE